MLRSVLVIMLALALVGSLASAQAPPPDYGYTAHGIDGNRIVAGAGTFPSVVAHVLPFSVPPAYVTPLPGRAAWLVLDDIGLYYQIARDGETFTADPVSQARAPRITPAAQGEGLRLSPAIADASPHAPAVPYGDGWLAVSDNGELLRADAGGAVLSRWQMALAADVVPVVNAAGQVAFYAGATNARYVHNIMGDDLEHTSLYGLTPRDDGDFRTTTLFTLPGDQVFEGLSPLWADVDEDGADDLITTVSDGAQGAQVVVYHADGEPLATGPAIGQGFRWRHQLAWGPFGEAGEHGLLEVLTPHIGGVVGFFVLEGDQLVQRASISGYTSHIINARQVDMAVAGDFNGDGTPELVLPTQARDRIAGLQVSGEGFREVWSVPLEGLAVTNLAATRTPAGELALAVGTSRGVQLWMPAP